MGMAIASADSTFPLTWKPKSRAAITRIAKAVMVVISRLVSVRPTSSSGRGAGASQFGSSTPASISFFSE